MQKTPDLSRNMSKSGVPLHPGQYLRETVLAPKRISVTDAAKLIGVSRPGVSNFLNGKVGTTPEMAARVERAFNIPAQTLLDMQASYDHARSKGAPANTKPYVPPFLSIKANDIERWASQEIQARIRLPVLLRTLVHSTGIGRMKVKFPGNDDAERPGWDGFVEADEGAPWIPEGNSGWEFGANQNIKRKADHDFAKSVRAVSKADREQITFVFVTPRRWAGKSAWIAAAQAKDQWKDVRAYDAQDLEQWFEQSLNGQTWFANETDHPSQGVRSLDKCWHDWADVASPPLSGTLFNSGIEAAKRTMLSRLSKEPNGPTVIAADSVEEALAFLSQLFGESGGEQLQSYRDRTLVFKEKGWLPRLAQGTQNFIAVVLDRDVERELGPYARSIHSIAVYPRNTVNAEPHIVLEPVSHETFRAALESMGYNRDSIARYDNESGRSLTVLRRRLSTVPAVRTPAWAADSKTAASLVPFLFVGAWNANNEADREALSLLADLPYEVLEKEFQHVRHLNDAPVWSIGTYRGVISKIDLLFAIAGSITTAELKNYFSLAKIALGEDDPALDLPEGDRWAASLYGKSREFSAAFRNGISETLVLLAVHGNKLFKACLGVDTELEATRVVQELLPTPLITRKLEANDRDLPTYAEAAPDTFLSILEKDLKTEQPAVLGLLRPVDAGVFGAHPARTGLLWALEGLSWNPATLPRAALILARLAQVEINDNWVNKPIHSLEAIFTVWMPQTAANHEERLHVIKLLAEKYPGIAWKICIGQFRTHFQAGEYSHKPRWRSDGYGFGEPIREWAPIIAFRREMVDMALGWKDHSRDMLCDLIERLYDADEEEQAKVWKLVNSWASRGSDVDRAVLREKIRATFLSWVGMTRSQKMDQASLTAAARAAYAALEPADLLNKHEWLFGGGWVEEPADELDDEDFDHRKREERTTRLQTDALREVMNERGIAGIYELAERGKAARQIGYLVAKELLPEKDIPAFLLNTIRPMLNSESWSRKNLIVGALQSIYDDAKRTNILRVTAEHLSQGELVQLLLLAPFCRSTWKMVDELDEVQRDTYWCEVTPAWFLDSDPENSEAIERLLAARRPRAAFSFGRFNAQKIEPSLLFRMLTEMAKGGNDKPGHYQLEQYSIEQAFTHLNQTTGLTLEQKAGLEFAYLDALARPWSPGAPGIPNLEKYLESHPELFVQAIVWMYKRSDGNEDPENFRVAPEKVQHFAERGHTLLEAIKRIPGHDDPGELAGDRLAKWVKSVRDACSELGRAETADLYLGKLLAHAPEGQDGVWPCEAVRQVMEDIQSESVFQGTQTGLYNARGAHWRGDGGGLERAIAEKYRRWAHALQYSHPFVSSSLLMGMVRMYEQDASREDTEASLRRRMR
jgi:addiction module HigA family antidote